MSSQELTTITFYIQMVTILVPTADSCVKLASIAKKFPMKNHWEWQWCARIQQNCFLILQNSKTMTNHSILHCFTLWRTWCQSCSHQWWADSFICRPWTFSVSWVDLSFSQQKIFIITVKNNNTRKLAQSLILSSTTVTGFWVCLTLCWSLGLYSDSFNLILMRMFWAILIVNKTEPELCRNWDSVMFSEVTRTQMTMRMRWWIVTTLRQYKGGSVLITRLCL